MGRKDESSSINIIFLFSFYKFYLINYIKINECCDIFINEIHLVNYIKINKCCDIFIREIHQLDFLR